MRLDPREFRTRPLRVHAVLHDVPLEDAWAIPLADGGADRTIQDVQAVLSAGLASAPAVVQGLFRLRNQIGDRLGWDRPRPDNDAESFVHRLSPADRARSLVPPGTPAGRFRVLYQFEDEQLNELRNATVHAFLSLSMTRTPDGYLTYLGIFVRPINRFTRLYMAAIRPFRHLIVYPAVVRSVQRAWAERDGHAPAAGST